MKTFFGPSLLRVLLGVSMATVIVILIYPFANIVFGKSLNTPWYFAILLFLSAVTISLGLIYVLGKAAIVHQDSDEIQTYFNSFDLTDDARHSEKAQQQDSPLKVTMDLYGTPITIESSDVGKIEDLMRYITRSIKASNLAEAKALHLRVRESTETYQTENNSE